MKNTPKNRSTAAKIAATKKVAKALADINVTAGPSDCANTPKKAKSKVKSNAKTAKEKQTVMMPDDPKIEYECKVYGRTMIKTMAGKNEPHFAVKFPAILVPSRDVNLAGKQNCVTMFYIY